MGYFLPRLRRSTQDKTCSLILSWLKFKFSELKIAAAFIVGLVAGLAIGWFGGYINPKIIATRHAAEYMNRVEPEFSGAAMYAISAIRLIEIGDTNTAIERLSTPIADYYNLYASHPGTNQYRIRAKAVIEEMARTNRIVAASIQHETRAVQAMDENGVIISYTPLTNKDNKP